MGVLLGRPARDERTATEERGAQEGRPYRWCLKAVERDDTLEGLCR